MPNVETVANILPKVGDLYYHYKHFTENPDKDILSFCFEIIGIACDAHNNSYSNKFVIYEPVFEIEELDKYDITCYSRPLMEFLEVVKVGGEDFQRFSLIEDPETFEKVNNLIYGI